MKVYVKLYYPDSIDESVQITGVTKIQPYSGDYEEFELENE